MTTEYSPIDLVFLVTGWTQGAAERMKGDLGLVKSLSVGRVTMLEDAARILARLYEEVQDEWAGDWEYEVAEPLGIWIGRASGRDGDMPMLAVIEAKARNIIRKAIRARAINA